MINRELVEPIVAISFVDDKYFLPVQMADMFANICYREAYRAAYSPNSPRENIFVTMVEDTEFYQLRLDEAFLMNIVNNHGKVGLEFVSKLIVSIEE